MPMHIKFFNKDNGNKSDKNGIIRSIVSKTRSIIKRDRGVSPEPMSFPFSIPDPTTVYFAPEDLACQKPENILDYAKFLNIPHTVPQAELIPVLYRNTTGLPGLPHHIIEMRKEGPFITGSKPCTAEDVGNGSDELSDYVSDAGETAPAPAAGAASMHIEEGDDVEESGESDDEDATTVALGDYDYTRQDNRNGPKYGVYPLERFPSPYESDDDADIENLELEYPEIPVHPSKALRANKHDQGNAPPTIAESIDSHEETSEPLSEHYLVNMLAEVEGVRKTLRSELAEAKAEVGNACSDIILSKAELEEEMVNKQNFFDRIQRVVGRERARKILQAVEGELNKISGNADGDLETVEEQFNEGSGNTDGDAAADGSDRNHKDDRVENNDDAKSNHSESSSRSSLKRSRETFVDDDYDQLDRNQDGSSSSSSSDDFDDRPRRPEVKRIKLAPEPSDSLIPAIATLATPPPPFFSTPLASRKRKREEYSYPSKERLAEVSRILSEVLGDAANGTKHKKARLNNADDDGNHSGGRETRDIELTIGRDAPLDSDPTAKAAKDVAPPGGDAPTRLKITSSSPTTSPSIVPHAVARSKRPTRSTKREG